MAVSQPTHLLVFNETSGTNVTNYGTNGTVYTIQAGSSPTNYEWSQQSLSPTAGLLDVKTKSGTNMPYLSTAASAFANTLTTVNFAVGFKLDSIPAYRAYFHDHPTANGTRVYAREPTGGGDFDLYAFTGTTAGGGQSYSWTALSFGTLYQLALSFDCSTPSATQIRFKLNSDATIEPATVNTTGQELTTTHGYILRDEGFTDVGSMDGKIYYWVYQRGGTAWTSTDLGDINSDPAANIGGWPSSIALISPLTWTRPNPLIGL